MRIAGIVSKSVPSKGIFDAPDGRKIPYDHDLVTVLVDGLDPVEVKVKRDQADAVPPFTRGSQVEVEVSVPKGTRLDFMGLAQPAKH